MKVAEQRGGLASFARLSRKPVRNADGPLKAKSDLWPCPVPLWGCWTELKALSPRRRKKHRLLRAKALGHASTPPLHARAGHPMSQQQESMLERLEDLVHYFFEVGPVTLDSLGRAGEKLSQLGKLALLIQTSSHSFEFDDLHSSLVEMQPTLDQTQNYRTG